MTRVSCFYHRNTNSHTYISMHLRNTHIWKYVSIWSNTRTRYYFETILDSKNEWASTKFSANNFHWITNNVLFMYHVIYRRRILMGMNMRSNNRRGKQPYKVGNILKKDRQKTLVGRYLLEKERSIRIRKEDSTIYGSSLTKTAWNENSPYGR